MDLKTIFQMFCEVNSDRETRINSLKQLVILGKSGINLKDLFLEIHEFFVSNNDIVRARACTLLYEAFNQILSQEGIEIEQKDLFTLFQFFCSKLHDISTVVEAAKMVELLFRKVLESMNNDASMIQDCVQILIESLDNRTFYTPSYTYETRKSIYRSLYYCLRNFDFSIFSDFVKVPQEFFLTHISGEKDPRNLLIVFDILNILIEKLDNSYIEEEIFPFIEQYYPLTFRGSDALGIYPVDVWPFINRCLSNQKVVERTILMVQENMVSSSSSDVYICCLETLIAVIKNNKLKQIKEENFKYMFDYIGRVQFETFEENYIDVLANFYKESYLNIFEDYFTLKILNWNFVEVLENTILVFLNKILENPLAPTSNISILVLNKLTEINIPIVRNYIYSKFEFYVTTEYEISEHNLKSRLLELFVILTKRFSKNCYEFSESTHNLLMKNLIFNSTENIRILSLKLLSLNCWQNNHKDRFQYYLSENLQNEKSSILKDCMIEMIPFDKIENLHLSKNLGSFDFFYSLLKGNYINISSKNEEILLELLSELINEKSTEKIRILSEVLSFYKSKLCFLNSEKTVKNTSNHNQEEKKEGCCGGGSNDSCCGGNSNNSCSSSNISRTRVKSNKKRNIEIQRENWLNILKIDSSIKIISLIFELNGDEEKSIKMNLKTIIIQFSNLFPDLFENLELSKLKNLNTYAVHYILHHFLNNEKPMGNSQNLLFDFSQFNIENHLKNKLNIVVGNSKSKYFGLNLIDENEMIVHSILKCMEYNCINENIIGTPLFKFLVKPPFKCIHKVYLPKFYFQYLFEYHFSKISTDIRLRSYIFILISSISTNILEARFDELFPFLIENLNKIDDNKDCDYISILTVMENILQTQKSKIKDPTYLVLTLYSLLHSNPSVNILVKLIEVITICAEMKFDQKRFSRNVVSKELRKFLSHEKRLVRKSAMICLNIWMSSN